MTAPAESNPGLAAQNTPAAPGALGSLTAMGTAGLALILTQILSFGSTLIVSRVLGPESYGRFGLALVFSIYAFSFIQWGVDPLLARNLARSNPGDARRELGAFFRQRQIFALVTLLAGLPLAFFWNVSAERALIYLGLVDGVILAFTVGPAFDAKGALSTYLFFAAIRQFLNLAAAGVLYLVAPQHATPMAFLVIHALCIPPQLLLEWSWLRRNIGAPDRNGASAGARTLTLAAAPMAVAAVALQVLCVTGPPVLEFFGQREAMGALVVSNLLATALSSFASVPARMIHVRLAQIPDTSSAPFRNGVIKWTGLSILAGILIALPLAALSDIFVTILFGQKFAAAVPLFAVDAWRIVGVLASAVLGSALICRQQIRAYAACHMLALLVTLAIAIIAVPTRGAIAAAGAVVIGRAAFALFAAVVFLLPAAKNKNT